MAITDLTGTKWVFDTTLLPVTTTHVRYGLSGSIEGTSYSFTSSNSGNFWAPLGNFTYGAVLINQLSSSIFHDLIQNSDGSWSISNNDDEYEVEALGNEVTLSFTGGNDVTNSTLIAWLQANATQVQEDTPTEFDLTTLHLSPGHYSIKAIAKASGFIDSAASTAVSYDVYGKCDTPITTIGSDGYTFAFTAVAHATSYTLYVDSSVAQTGITTPPTSLDLRNLHLAAGAHTIQIKAIGSGYYNDSDLSTALTYTVYTITATLQNATANPSNVTKIDPGAVATLIYTFDGVSYECPTTGPVVTNATGTWTKNSTTQGTLVLSAASGNVSYTVSGAEVMPQLDQVTNVSVTGTEATFDEVEHAESYEFFVDGNSIGTYTPVSYVQVYPTKSGNYTLLSDMDQSKKYSVLIDTNSVASYQLGHFSYNGSAWVNDLGAESEILIQSQTPTSVTFYRASNTGGTLFEQWDPCVVVEGGDYLDTATLLTYTPDNVGADWRCFVEGTNITLADGSTKTVENIDYDDSLLVYDFYEGKLASAKPIWIMQEKTASQYKKVTLSDGTVLRLVGAGDNCHRVFNVTKQKFLYANECVGDEVYKQDGSIVTIVSCENVDEEVKYYNLTTEKYLDCFAEGVLTGSRLNNMYHISDMKYDSDERLISEEEEASRWAVREANKK